MDGRRRPSEAGCLGAELAGVCLRVAAFERIAKKAKKSAERAKVWAIGAVVLVVAVAVLVAVLLLGDCLATGCYPREVQSWRG